jgi:hypothetical protein
MNSWPTPFGPIVVFAHDKNMMNNMIRNSAGNRDGPLIFHMRDGPPNVTGPPRGSDPPENISCGTGPPIEKGLPMDWLTRKKNLEKIRTSNLRVFRKIRKT